MVSHSSPLRKTMLVLVIFSNLFLGFPFWADAFCHEIQLTRTTAPRFMRVAAQPRSVTIQWLGHAAFLLTSSKGTQVLMDPHGRMGQSLELSPQVVTTSHLHGNHSSIWMAQGNPIVLHGLDPEDGDWQRVHRVIRDLSIYTVPTYHDGEMGLLRGKNAAFVVSVDGLCLAHLGDLGHLFNKKQLELMGKIDVLLVPLGQGGARIDSRDAAKVVRQIKPKVAIPQHYRWEGYMEEFVGNFDRVRRLDGNSVKLSKDTLTSELEVVVLKDTLAEQQD